MRMRLIISIEIYAVILIEIDVSDSNIIFNISISDIQYAISNMNITIRIIYPNINIGI